MVKADDVMKNEDDDTKVGQGLASGQRGAPRSPGESGRCYPMVSPPSSPMTDFVPAAPVSTSSLVSATPRSNGVAVVARALDMPDLRAPNLYLNRELSWLEFNARVLAEAENEAVPLLERLKFHAIVASNLDEFFMVRVAGLKQQLTGEVDEMRPDGMTIIEQLTAISQRVHELVERQSNDLTNNLLPQLARAGHPPRQAGVALARGAGRPRPALQERDLPDPHADRHRPGAPVPPPAQQEPQPRRHVPARRHASRRASAWCRCR